MSDVKDAEIVTVAPEGLAAPSAPVVHLVARSPLEMQNAQGDLAAWLRNKLTGVEAEIVELNAALTEARSNGWATRALTRQRDKAVGQETFYFKVLSAVEAGFVIIPQFPIDIFAIRVARKNVTGHYVEHKNSYAGRAAREIPLQVTDHPKAGEGRYESPVALLRGGTSDVDDGKGGKDRVEEAFTSGEWGEIVFPIQAARPVVMNATAQAMALKVFDQIGVCLPQTGAGVSRRGDPLIIGQILGKKEGYSQRCLSFIIAWHLSLNDL